MASLSCFSALLNIQETIPAMLEWMVCTNNVKSLIEVAHITILCGTVSLSKRSFVEELLLIASRPDDSARALLRLEAMSLLSKIAKNYSPALRHVVSLDSIVLEHHVTIFLFVCCSANWRRLADFMLSAFQDSDPNVRLQAVKILENYIKGEGVNRVETLPEAGDTYAASPTESRGYVAPAGSSPGRIANNRWPYSAQVCFIMQLLYFVVSG